MNINQLKKLHPEYTYCQYVSTIFTRACINDDQQVISYLLENCPKPVYFVDGIFHCMCNGKFDMAKYIYESGNYNFFDHFSGQKINIILKNSIDNLEMTKWIYNLIVDKTVINVDKLFHSAIDVNNIPAIKWIQSVWPNIDIIKKPMNCDLIDSIVQHNDIELFKLMINTWPDDVFKRLHTFAETAMRYGHVELLQWLIENYPTYMLTGDKFNSQIKLYFGLFENMCANYYIDLLEFITPFVDQSDLSRFINICYECDLVDVVYHIIRCHDISDASQMQLCNKYITQFADDVELVNTSATKSARKKI